ncbi:hypothetical protein U7230_04995 [Carboxydochorda subterranea]|uniref:Uncharacterized protein n=1 Tax=Carboxydichorda subterranea TaxID=3109565 RepID=A0ABZ1C039_9FIRM|nr:hypothetical protein [Limnochorda sp. L945t]WRP18368.1 hypothetical protein U7230_04995 [Limnochorda sp. L945t]
MPREGARARPTRRRRRYPRDAYSTSGLDDAHFHQEAGKDPLDLDPLSHWQELERAAESQLRRKPGSRDNVPPRDEKD